MRPSAASSGNPVILFFPALRGKGYSSPPAIGGSYPKRRISMLDHRLLLISSLLLAAFLGLGAVPPVSHLLPIEVEPETLVVGGGESQG
jgi:hypothetical protein